MILTHLYRLGMSLCLAVILQSNSFALEPMTTLADNDIHFTQPLSNIPAMPVIKPVRSNSTVQHNYTLEELGAEKPMRIEGVRGEYRLPLSIRSDHLITRAHLKLKYSYSPSLLPDLSQMNILMNREVIATTRLTHEEPMPITRTFDLDPRLFFDFNHLDFQFLGHYTMECEDSSHSSLWLNISNQSELELTWQPIPLANDLSILPRPFFDPQMHNQVLQLPFVFAAQPSLETLRAAGLVASWFGIQADYRGARFPVLLNQLPEGNAVVFITPDEHPKGIALNAQYDTTLHLIDHPYHSTAKLLLVMGRDGPSLLRAAQALALGQATLSGAYSQIEQVTLPAPRQPYDAPKWLPTDRAVTFAEMLADGQSLQIKQVLSGEISLPFYLPPDLFSWRQVGVPVDLQYRHTPLPQNEADRSSLNINLNEQFVQALPLNHLRQGLIDRTRVKLLGHVSAEPKQILLPTTALKFSNQLQFHFSFGASNQNACHSTMQPNQQAAISPESSIDFSSFPHYTALPELSYFANSGYPYSRLADYAETAIVLPEKRDKHSLSLFLGLMGRLGHFTGYPPLRAKIIETGQLTDYPDHDLILFAAGEETTVPKTWHEHMPVHFDQQQLQIRWPGFWQQWLSDPKTDEYEQQINQVAKIGSLTQGLLATITAFESPLQSERSVVVLWANQSAALNAIQDTWLSPEWLRLIQGDITLIRPTDQQRIHSARVGQHYYVGHLPWTTALLWYFHRHPLLMIIILSFAALLLGILSYIHLRRRAANRLAGNSG